MKQRSPFFTEHLFVIWSWIRIKGDVSRESDWFKSIWLAREPRSPSRFFFYWPVQGASPVAIHFLLGEPVILFVVFVFSLYVPYFFFFFFRCPRKNVRGAQLILAYSLTRPAILVAGKSRGGRMFLFLLFLHFHSFSSFFPVPLLRFLLYLFFLFSTFLWKTTQNDPQGMTCR